MPGSSCGAVCDYSTGQWVVRHCYMLEARPNDPYILDIDNMGATDIGVPVIHPSNINTDNWNAIDDKAPVIDPNNIEIGNWGATDNTMKNES